MRPKIELACAKCGGTEFTATLEGRDHHVELRDKGTNRPVNSGQRCQVMMVCKGCGAWFAFDTVVHAVTEWGRKLQAVVDAARKDPDV